MKYKLLWLTALVLSIYMIPGYTQYIRHNEYATEQQRRQQYALDDWISYLESKHISSIAVGTNYIYFGALDGGILRYHLFENYWDYPYTTSNGLASNRVLDVAYDETNGLLWAVTDVDTCVFRPAEEEWACKGQPNFWDYRFPRREQPNSGEKVAYNVVYSRRDLGLLPTYFANGPFNISGDWKVIDENFVEYPISGFLRDRFENVWFIIDGLGVGKGNYYSQRIDIIPLGLTHINPRVIRYQDKDLWIGGVKRRGPGLSGIVNWRNSDGGWYYYEDRYISRLPSDNVSDIVTAGDSVWFATDYGVTLFDTRRNKWKNFKVQDGLYSLTVNDLLIHDTTLYVATDNGLNTIDLPTGIVKRFEGEQIKMATIYQVDSQQDTIWAATNRGILRLKPGRIRWEAVETTASIQVMPALAVQAFEDEVWFTSPEGVLWYDNKTRKWHSFPQLGLEMSGPFFDLAVNWKSVWVSTSRGLLKYDRKRQYWIIFTTQDGLLNNQCYRLLLDGDYLWVANQAGITQFYWNNPDRID